MNKQDDFIYIEGLSYWASLCIPNITFDPCYQISLKISKKLAKDFKKLGFRVDKKSQILIKKKALIHTKPPLVFDENEKQLESVPLLGNGTKVVVRATEWEIVNPFGTFKGLYLDAVMIKSLLSFESKEKFWLMSP